jgi:hypothetical protein
MNRIATTLATAGIAVFAGVALAPAASAASTAPVQDGPSYVIEANNAGNGPDAFIVTEQGRTPVFFCEDEKDKGKKDDKKDAKAEDKAKDAKEKKIKHGNKCISIGDEESGRF